MYPLFRQGMDDGSLTLEKAQELLDCIWVKLNDLNKVRDAASAEGFAGYGLFQNLIVGGQDEQGMDVTNELSYMCLEAQLHVRLPQPSLSIRVWNLTPHALLIKAASVTREGLGVPAFYNDEVIIPSMMSRGYTLEDARNYCIIGCVEPQACAKTDGWHDAAFFNMLRPLELVFSNGVDKGEQIGPRTGDVLKMTSFEEFYKAYTTQESALIEMMVQADNAVDVAHAVRCPLPFESCLIDDCISRGKSVQEGGAHYNFPGPQGFGIANVADSLAVVRELVFEKKLVSMAELKQALADNFGKGYTPKKAGELTAAAAKTGLKEAAVTATGKIGGVQAVVAVLDSRFFMGSMSTAVGEKITRAVEYAADKHLPLVIFSASGGARMQEGIFSLMQMAKTSAALERFSRRGGLYISVLTHPTTGGVTASFASLGDIMLAEPGALIGFAGPRVIEQTIGEKLPHGFQRSEFQLEHGFLDQVVPRAAMKETLERILRLHTQRRKYS